MTTDITAPAAPDAAPASGADASAPAGFVRRNRWRLILVGLLAAIVGAGALYTFAVLNFSYSTGERVGFVQKISKKGWICRTWEGELAMSPVPGATPQIFAFSLRDEALAKQISAAEGKRVSLQYEEKKGIPTSCFGETSYFVTGVRPLGN